MQWNIGYIAKKRAKLSCNKPALIYEDTPITYAKLNEETNRAAHYLQGLGLKKGDRICVLLLNCPEFLYIYFAAAKLGLIFVPLNFRLVGPELEYQLNNCGARMLVFHDLFVGNVNSIRSRVAVEKDKFLWVKSLTPDCPGCPEWAANYDEVMKNCATDEPEPEEPVNMDDPLAIIYTSGVTGAPKGALVSHSQTYFKNFQVMFYTDMREDDIFLAQLPLFHSGGLFVSFNPGLCRGVTMIMRQGFDPGQFAVDIEKYRATVVLALTTMWRFVLETGKLGEIDSSSVRSVLGGGERTPQILFDELAKGGLRLQQGFGQTENSAMMFLPKEDIKRKQGSIGLPGFFSEIWIQDEQGKKLPPREIGEIVARGPNVMMGYWNMPEKTAETIIDGMLHTGDLGYTDEDGYFYIVDRAKDMYRSGGENVYPAEIEKVLSEHPKILNVSIIGVPDERWGETGKAFVVPKEGQSLTPEEVIAFLKDKVAKYKYPTHVEFLDSLPMTASGKIAKAELKKRYGVRLDK
ncbi:MAG: AMP-dependent synthetase [Syntrophobacterales bacterium CG_4_8_14_3_um_filter_49_14]|nr:MAG: AMP-dependent synthetase [Syntrophobacterales bacterium CG_4_8_14_3_um_filter_49_14]